MIQLIIGVILALLGFTVFVAILEAVKLIIIMIISVPLLLIYKQYIFDYLVGLDERISWIGAIVLTIVTAYILYQNWLLLILGSIFIYVVYYIIKITFHGPFGLMKEFKKSFKKKWGEIK